MRLTRAQKDMLHELSSGQKLAVRFGVKSTASADKTCKWLMGKNLVRVYDHPKRTDWRGLPIEVVELTDDGLAIVRGESPELNKALDILLKQAR